MSECYSRIFIENGIIRNRLEFDLGKVFEDEVIYEVIRIRKGIPLFLFDHFERLERSASYSGRELFLSYDQLREQILKLIGLSSIPEGNIKVSLKYSPAYTGYLIYYIDARYPDAEMYENGVRGILYELIHTKAYEALLVNRAGCITEGSRSNIFFIKEGKIITAPDECVLGGITRKKLLKICRDEDLKIEYRCLPVDELGSVDSAYMTGTSPNVLPFSEIDSYKFSVKNETMKLVAGRYMQMIYDYMAEFENKYR